ncbi:hypothetical protein HHI36_022205 [Cryptolaemus montrouzieri]|uniref:Uncharacterized protein n=1 Tax=Cryptolaemus montrouzieri TaxID=559131 RepID=A0ABD2MZD8_9CUCU
MLKRVLSGVTEAIDIVEGKLIPHEALAENAKTEEKIRYEESSSYYNRVDSNTLLILTTNITEETLTKDKNPGSSFVSKTEKCQPSHSRNLQSEEDGIEERSQSLIEDFTNNVSEDDEDENEDEDR